MELPPIQLRRNATCKKTSNQSIQLKMFRNFNFVFLLLFFFCFLNGMIDLTNENISNGKRLKCKYCWYIIMNVIGKQITCKQWSTSWYHNFSDVDVVISIKWISVIIIHVSEINYSRLGEAINSEKIYFNNNNKYSGWKTDRIPQL